MRLLLFCLLLGLVPAGHAQMEFNSPTGVRPTHDIELYNQESFIVQQKYKFTAAKPQSATSVRFCGSGTPFLTAQAGILTDPSNFIGYPINVAFNSASIEYINSNGPC